MKGRRDEADEAHEEKWELRRPWSPPSKDPSVSAKLTKPSNVFNDGMKTNTPELKQSGHPMSGVAVSSSRSNNSSMFATTRVSASIKTHFVYSTGFHAWILVRVTPSSGRFIKAK